MLLSSRKKSFTPTLSKSMRKRTWKNGSMMENGTGGTKNSRLSSVSLEKKHGPKSAVIFSSNKDVHHVAEPPPANMESANMHVLNAEMVQLCASISVTKEIVKTVVVPEFASTDSAKNTAEIVETGMSIVSTIVERAAVPIVVLETPYVFTTASSTTAKTVVVTVYVNMG